MGRLGMGQSIHIYFYYIDTKNYYYEPTCVLYEYNDFTTTSNCLLLVYVYTLILRISLSTKYY
jgi:hypothetical protein